MIIREIKGNIDLTLPKFQCDYELTEKDISPLPNTHFFMVVCGRAGSGKTSIATSLLTSRGKKTIYRKIFDNVIIIMPKNSLNSLIDNHPFKKHDKVYNEMNLETLDEINEMVKDYAEENENTLLFIDDMASSLKNKNVSNMLNNFINNRRHLHLSIMLLTQYLNSIPLPVRRNISHLIMFKPTNKKETDIIFTELIFLTKDEYDEILKYSYKSKHDFLFINLVTNEIYRNFNKLELNLNNDIINNGN